MCIKLGFLEKRVEFFFDAETMEAFATLRQLILGVNFVMRMLFLKEILLDHSVSEP